MAQVKTTLGKIFETWKLNNDGTDEQLITLLRTTPAKYRELQGQMLSPAPAMTSSDRAGASAGPYPTKQTIDSLANRCGVSAAGLTSIIKGL